MQQNLQFIDKTKVQNKAVTEKKNDKARALMFEQNNLKLHLHNFAYTMLRQRKIFHMVLGTVKYNVYV